MVQRLLGAVIAFALTVFPALAEPQPNHLSGTQSPYLLQHLYNPVDWYPWGEEALQKARRENKPIFVSVGYSSCHWCHVMREESFESQAIAELLNKNFVSIKIDRETRPDLDEQFQLVTEIISGGGGWPNAVFLTPTGDPFFAAGYLPPANFAAVINELAALWQQDQRGVAEHAATIALTVSERLTRKAAAREITPEIADAAATQLVSEMDTFYGGLGVTTKFPREPLFLFLLDEAERTGSRQFLRAVTDMLDGMIKGGIHDFLGGGFHRYAVDPEWHVPHFEKMLYTQALTGRLLLRAYDMTGLPRYRWAAQRTFDYVLRELRAPEGGFYAAQDADSLKPDGESVEGAFYIWTPGELAALEEDEQFARDVFQITAEGEFEGANVLNLAALPEELADELNMQPAAFFARLDALALKMARLRAARPAPFLDRKIVVSWNGAMIETLAEAGDRLSRPDYYEAAEAAARFIEAELMDNDRLKRIWIDGSGRGEGQLSDYAALGLGFVALYDHAPQPERAKNWLDKAQSVARTLHRKFNAADNGYRMTEQADGLSAMIPLDDVDIPSGNALALTLFARLSQRMPAPETTAWAFELAAAISGHAADAPDRQGFALKAIRELQSGGTGPVRHAANGVVRAEFFKEPDSADIVVDIAIADGWHINAHQPLEDYLIPTNLEMGGTPGSLSVEYPKPLTKALSFSKKPLALYEGRLKLTASGGPQAEPGAPQKAKLTLQACSDQICLQPEVLTFTLWR